MLSLTSTYLRAPADIFRGKSSDSTHARGGSQLAREPEPQRAAPAPEPEPEPEPHADYSQHRRMEPGWPASRGQDGGQAEEMDVPGAAERVVEAPGTSPPTSPIPVPNIVAAKAEPEGAAAARPTMIVGRSLCDLHSDSAVGQTEADRLPAPVGATPPLLSMIRQTADSAKKPASGEQRGRV